MADLEDHAIRRDPRFLVRLAVLLACGLAFGLWAMQHLTSQRTASQAAEWLGEPAHDDGAAGAR